MSTDWDSISTIAHYTAQVWVRENLPWAWRFDTPTGRLLYRTTEPLFLAASRLGFTTPVQFCVQRHRIIDALVAERGPAQVVELGGGLSPRCLALAQKQGIPCIDVDLPAMTGAKEHLAGSETPESYRQVSMDIVDTEDYVEALAPALQRLHPTVVITEGLLSYLDLGRQRAVFGRIARLLRWCGGGTYFTDVHHEEAVQRLGPLASAFRTTLHAVSRTRQVAFIHDFESGRVMLERAGFTGVVGHRPCDFQQTLDLPLRNIDSGLAIYEATVEP